jgi:hypothetical protein
VSARIRASSKIRRFQCFVLIDVRFICEPREYEYPSLKTAALDVTKINNYLCTIPAVDGISCLISKNILLASSSIIISTATQASFSSEAERVIKYTYREWDKSAVGIMIRVAAGLGIVLLTTAARPGLWPRKYQACLYETPSMGGTFRSFTLCKGHKNAMHQANDEQSRLLHNV